MRALGNRHEAINLVHAAQQQRDQLRDGGGGSLRDLGEAFSFSLARQHYYNAATYAHSGDWDAVRREAETVIGLYDHPAASKKWPVTMSLAQVHLAQARLHTDGPDGAFDALQPVLAIPGEQRIPQTSQALRTLRRQLRATPAAGLPAARDLDEAIDNFQPHA